MLISICIPTYSRLNYLKQAVASAQAQTYQNIQICISQNPKENGADRAIRDWCLQQKQAGIIKYSVNEKNLGLTGNLNKLITIANGEYVIFLGDDDLLAPTFISSAVERLENEHADILFTNQFFIDENGEILKEVTSSLNHNYKRDELEEGIIKNAVEVVFNNSIPLSASLIKKDLFKNYTFNETLNTPELPFFLKVALNKHSFIYVNKQLAYYRLHKNSETFNGLAIDALLYDLINIPVPDEYQKLKADYIQRAMVPAINKALIKGNYKLVKFLLQSGYYPKKTSLKFIHQTMRYLPLSFIRVLFKLRKATTS